MTGAISPEAVMAWAIIAARRNQKPILIEDVSNLFAKLRQEKIEEVGRVALRRIPHGLYSEDVEAFFARLLAGGFANAPPPLYVDGQGIQPPPQLISQATPPPPQHPTTLNTP